MIAYRCDGCGVEMESKALRYTVDIEVRAAYDKLHVSLADLLRDHREEIVALIEKLKGKAADRLEESVYRHIKLDLCPRCQRAFLKNPLRFHPEQSGGEGADFNVDDFLRSLGADGSTPDAPP